MHFLGDILITILGLLLLTSIIAVSQYLKLRSELLSNINEYLKIEINVLSICDQENNTRILLDKLVEFLNSNGVKWVSIELSSENDGKVVIYNEKVSTVSEGKIKYIRALKITNKDVMYITVGVKND